MAVRVGFQGLDNLRRQLRQVTSPQFTADLARVLGATALKQLADEFRGERDPYGNPWAPLKLRKGRILRDTGRMAASAAVNPRPAGFELTITARYAHTHQRGMTIRPVRARRLRWKTGGTWYSASKVTVPRRQMLPEAETGGWGPIWTEAFQKQTAAFVRDHFRGGRK